jgi:hypothetical protein
MSIFRSPIVNLIYHHHLTHPSQLYRPIDDTLVCHRIIMIDLLLSLVDFKQREVVVVAIQRTEIHETDVLPVLNLGFAAELFDCVSPTSQWPGDAFRAIPAKTLGSIQRNAVAISHEKRFVRHLHAGHYHPVVQPLALAKHVECVAEYIHPAVQCDVVVRLEHPLALAEDLGAHVVWKAAG